MTVIYRAEGLPTFQNRVFPTKVEAISCPQGTVELAQDPATGIVTNQTFNPADMVYDENYQNEQANSAAFRSHLGTIADLIDEQIGKSDIVEIGCGKGFFLEMMAARGSQIIGCDPTYEGDNPAVIREYFAPDLGFKKGSGLILRHVLEHIQNPYDFLKQLRDTNGGHGKIYIEVPCFDWIISHKAWFDVFYEHVNYFRMSDFERMFGRLHFAERTFGGQYLSIVGDLATLRDPGFGPNVAMPSDFAPDVAKFEAGAAVWGAASKGVLFNIMMQRAGKQVAATIDINPTKQRKYLPVSGSLVESPESALERLPEDSVVYVMNGNYLREIVAVAGPKFRCVAIDA